MPGRVAVLINGQLSPHWSVLTAFGDGMVFAMGLSDTAAAQRLLDCAASIVDSGVPGVIVINLHPQNFSCTRALQAALHEIIRLGFIPWTLADCWRWFDTADRYNVQMPGLQAAAARARAVLGIRS